MNRSRFAFRSAIPAILASLLIPSIAHAHTGVGATHGWSHGFLHPLSGVDHLCAMIAVGLWASQMGGRALWVVPLTFVCAMAAGGAIGMTGASAPFVETGIIMSVLILGVLIAGAVRLPTAMSTILVGLFAICHGHAHGSEMPASASGLLYGMGFMISTAMLHLAGIGLGVAVQRAATKSLVRVAGGGIAMCGVYLLLFQG